MMNVALINNRYRILETIGRGGFGETYLAEDLHMPSGRKCIIKQLKPIVEQPTIPLWMKERFQREAAILEALGAASHQIPELYAYFSEKGQFYLVQEWIEGETLAQKWQRQGNFTSAEVSQILSQILPVLEFIHQQKIVHRDIKPENIILRSDRNAANSQSLPVLIDFGAVKEAMATTAHHHHSALSAVIGTPGYMSSEQAAGRPLYSSDLYSLGLTAIFLLTGKSPQELEIDAQTGEIIWDRTSTDDVLAQVITKAIRFHPRDRFSQAQEMLAALKPQGDRSQANSPVTSIKTVKVAPAVASLRGGSNNKRDFVGTVAYDHSADKKRAKKGGLLSKLVLFLLVSGGLSVGVVAAGFYTVSNWWQSWTQPTPQVKVPRTPKSKPVLVPFPKEEPETPEEETKENSEVEEAKKPPRKILEELKNKLPQKPQSIPEVVIQPQPIPQKPLEVPILTAGISESQLVSTLGTPTSQRNEPRSNSKILTYRNVTSNNVNLTYHADTNGQIKQADVALSQELSLGSMQETLTKLLQGKSSTDAKNKLRDVYNRKSDRYSFRIDNLRGSIYRDAKDRVNISVWK